MKNLFLILAIFLVAACQTTNQDGVYTEDSLGTESYVENGVVASMRTVTVITPHKSSAVQSGVINGTSAAARSAIGSSLGGGILGSIGSSVGGAVTRDAMRETSNSIKYEEDATEYIIKKEYETVVIVQKDNLGIKPGDRVLLVSGNNGKTRIIKDESK